MSDPVEETQADRMLIEAIINDYHTTRMDSDYVSHILSKPRTKKAFALNRIEAEKRAREERPKAAYKAGVAFGRADERKAIVKWLRDDEQWCVPAHELGDAIERGDDREGE